MSSERLDWIYGAPDARELQRRYDAWSLHYDADMAVLDWGAPLAAAGQCLDFGGRGAVVLDAGCGTGLVGVALRDGGAGSVIGLDFSAGMLGKAAHTGAYDLLLQASLTEPLPLAARSLDAVVSVGVFTFGHVGPAPLAALAVLVRPGGTLTLSFRDDVYSGLGFVDVVRRAEEAGTLALLHCSEPAPLVSEHGEGVPMRVWTWKVR